MVFERVVSTPNPPMSHEVLYIGSAIPLKTSEGLEAVQQPLQARYPVDNDETIQGILSTIVIVPEGIQLRFQGENSPPILFLFSSLSMCAAVRCVRVTDPATGVSTPRFVALASPQAGGPNSSKPAIFTAITRRTKGRQVLECHGFVTNTPRDALDLVQWTSTMDQRSKSSRIVASPTGGANFGTPQRFDGDMSFRASDTSSLPDFPIHIKPADPVVAHNNNNNNNTNSNMSTLNGATSSIGSAQAEHLTSKDGFFYSTKHTQVKRYSLQRFHGSSGVDDSASVIGAGGDLFTRRPASAYAASQVSATASQQHHHHHQQHSHASQQHQHQHLEHHAPLMYHSPPGMVPVPVPVPHPVVAVRPPPPPPPHMMVPEAPQTPRLITPARPAPRGLTARQTAGRGAKPRREAHQENHQQARAGGSSEGSSSRPQTPPTDYEGGARGPRVSRREDFMMRERNGYATLPPPGAAGVYMMPPYPFYPLPPGAYERTRSQPPLDRKFPTAAGSEIQEKGEKIKEKRQKVGSEVLGETPRHVRVHGQCGWIPVRDAHRK
ncbi:hypothetical protein EGW08_017187 [Elysia chlorotica]|uniref:PID domain-containing protein n=1 Tax=Elysia chlorotica TaxID=188477 RepID=A0A3S1B4W6_ELYCH|nr:hypothetical protein EGW08_017187 [Elysia chlorotica]